MILMSCTNKKDRSIKSNFNNLLVGQTQTYFILFLLILTIQRRKIKFLIVFILENVSFVDIIRNKLQVKSDND